VTLSLWNVFAMFHVGVLCNFCSFLTCSHSSQASFSSSFASSIWVSVAVRMAQQNDAQSVWPVPVTFCSTLGIAFQMVPMRSPLVSGIAAASRSILSAQTTWANSSTPFSFTLIPTSSSLIVAHSSAVCFSSTVFTIGALLGHLVLKAPIRWFQVSLSVGPRLSHHWLVVAPAFKCSSNVLSFCVSVILVFRENCHSMPLMKSLGFSSSCLSSPQKSFVVSDMVSSSVLWCGGSAC
jgi:hypothetical protein